MNLTIDKPKNKHAPHTHRRLHLLLLAWMVVTFLAALYPPIWLMPPYMYMTPSPYVILSLGWIPVASWHIWRYGWRKLTMLLITMCLLGNGMLATFMFERMFYRCTITDVSPQFFCEYGDYGVDPYGQAIKHHYRGQFLHLGLGLALLLNEEHTTSLYDAARR